MKSRIGPLFVALCLLMSSRTPSSSAPRTPQINGLIAYGFADGWPGLEPDNIFTVDPSDGAVSQVTSGLSQYTSPSWSPDGRRLAVVVGGTTWDFDIYVIDADNGSEVRLTNDPRGWDLSPHWSPDGTEIAFMRVMFPATRDEGEPPLGAVETAANIWVMNADGTDLRQVTNRAGGESLGGWSPDGTKLVFNAPSGPNKDGPPDIFVVDSDGSAVTNLTNSEGFDCYPSWSPDGTRIAFTSDRSGNDDIWVMSADGSNLVPLTSTADEDSVPEWSPDGEYIVFARSAPPSTWTNLFVMKADGSDVHQVTRVNGFTQSPSWQRRCTQEGGEGPDSLRGTESADIICSYLGDDALYGGAGRDVMLGDAGADELSGGNGNDFLGGGEGNDRLVGGRGVDAVYGGPGDDLLNAKDGVRDVVNGGPGHDSCQLDPFDDARGCDALL